MDRARRLHGHQRCAGLPVPAGIPDPTRTRGYGSGTGRCLTGRVGYGYEVHGSGIPVFTRKKHHFSEHEREFTFAICRRPSVCLLSSVTFVHPTQAIEIFRSVSTPFGTLAICDPSVKILRRSSQGNLSVVGLNQRGVEKCSDFGHFQGYISETVV